MLVVIGIIALIAAVLTPSLIGQMGRARAKTAQMQLDTIAAAVEAFRSDTGAYPTTDQGLAVLIADREGAIEGWTGPYLKNDKFLKDPWGTPVVYSPTGQGFTVTSWGADRAASPGATKPETRDLTAP
jgi:general secretion pathway protein G